jgi:hypothetical protein
MCVLLLRKKVREKKYGKQMRGMGGMGGMGGRE